MPSFFDFQQGTESRTGASDSSPLLGRFRAVPDAQRQARRVRSHGLLGSFTGGRGLANRYSLVFGSADDNDSDEGESDGEDVGALRRWGRLQKDLWLEPKQAAVTQIVDKWWSRWIVLAILPAALVCHKAYLNFWHYE